jgi:hypothetical protein
MALPLGSKRYRGKKWALCKTARKLETSNIAVRLGRGFGNLCSIDIDSEPVLEKFLQLNPLLKWTLRSKSKRGCNLWIRVDGPFSGLKHLVWDGETVGEFRSDGAYTIIQGKHP